MQRKQPKIKAEELISDYDYGMTNTHNIYNDELESYIYYCSKSLNDDIELKRLRKENVRLKKCEIELNNWKTISIQRSINILKELRRTFTEEKVRVLLKDNNIECDAVLLDDILVNLDLLEKIK